MLTPDMISPPTPPRGSPWFFYPLAILVVSAVLFTPTGEAETPKLRPDQQRAVELSLRGMDPAMVPFMRETMAKNLAPYGEAQIAALIAGLESKEFSPSNSSADNEPDEEAAEPTLSPEDFAFNRAQYEPVIRKAHAAQKKFDDFVNARLQAKCPKPGAAARWGSAWRYELIPLKEEWSTASWNPDSDVQVIGSVYGPQDGRYKFDFSKVRFTFDEKVVGDAIDKACADYGAKGKEFLAKLDPLVAREDWEGAHRLEQSAMRWIDPIRSRMEDALNKQSPNGNQAIMDALQNGKRIK
jgi:hypothetical protein